MSFPKTGRSFPGRSGDGNGTVPERGIAAEIAAALRQELGPSHAAVKTVVRWTGASERTVKNWLGARYAPSGEHMVALVRYSDAVLFAVLTLAGREDVAAAAAVSHVRDRLRWIVEALDLSRAGTDVSPSLTSRSNASSGMTEEVDKPSRQPTS